MNTITRTADDAVLVRHETYAENTTNTPLLIEQTTKIVFPSSEFTSQKWSFEGMTIFRDQWTGKSNSNERNAIFWKHDFDGVYNDFLLSGQQTATNNRWQKNTHVMAGQQHSVLYTQGYEGATWSDTPESEMVMFKIAKPVWLQLTNDSNDTFQRFTENILEGRSIPLSAHNLPLTHTMHAVIRQILDCHFTGGLKKMFLFSKCLELIVLQAEAYNQHEHVRGGTFKQMAIDPTLSISRSQKERLYFAQEYMRSNLAEPPSFPELARVVGLSEYQLKRGFKAMFGETVFGFLAGHRLERAQMLLLEREKSVSEIAYELGYSSPQHFSTAFKKKFGVSPKMVQAH